METRNIRAMRNFFMSMRITIFKRYTAGIIPMDHYFINGEFGKSNAAGTLFVVKWGFFVVKTRIPTIF